MGQKLQLLAQILSIATAAWAAVVWYKASKIKTPTTLSPLMASPIDGSGDVGLEADLREIAKGIAEQSHLNSNAALLTAGSVLFQMIATILPFVT